MSMKEKIRESINQRFFNMETLRTVIEWIKTTNPRELYVMQIGKETNSAVSEEELRQIQSDWVDKASELITKAWVLPSMMVEDAVKVMSEVTGHAVKEGTSQSK